MRDGRLIEHGLAAVCGIEEDATHSVREVLISGLANSRSLVLLDGCEHLVDACAEVTGELLRSCRRLTILATSREPLGVSGEVIWRTPSLTTPRVEDAGRPELLMESEAIRLFVDRTRLSRSDLELEARNAAAIAQICTRLEGLPLAIELAAGLAAVMTLDEILARLEHRFQLLAGGSRSSPPRHKTLRQTMDWSYELLAPAEQALFARLGVFAGGFDLVAAEAVTLGPPITADDVVPVLSRLVHKSLVVAEPTRQGRTRYRMLDTMREYALEKLQETGEPAYRRAHAAYYLGLCAEATGQLNSPEQVFWLVRLDEEQPNMRAAIDWMLTGWPEGALRLAGLLGRYWYMRRRLSEGIDWLVRALAADSQQSEIRAGAWLALARLRSRGGAFEAARNDAEQCIVLCRKLGLDKELARALTLLGIARGFAKDWTAALERFNEALALLQKQGDRMGVIGSLNNLAMVHSEQGEQDVAQRLIDKALPLAEELGDRFSYAMIVESAGRIALRSGRFAVARRQFGEALGIAARFEDALNLASCLEGVALVTLHDGDPAKAITMMSAAQAIRAPTGTGRTPGWASDVDSGLAGARARMSRLAAEGAWRKGSAMSFDQAVRLGLGRAVEPDGDGHTALTPREVQVARLIASGLTNPQMARRLRIASRTADAHVEHIRNKLGLRTRSQIAVWAHERLGESRTD